MKTIAVAVNASSSARNAAMTGAYLANQCGARLLLMQCVPLLDAVSATVHVQQSADRVTVEMQVAQDTLASIKRATTEQFPTLKVETQVLTGTPALAILTAAEAEDADMVVIGSHGHNPLTRSTLGRVANAIVQSCQRPVLVVR